MVKNNLLIVFLKRFFVRELHYATLARRAMPNNPENISDRPNDVAPKNVTEICENKTSELLIVLASGASPLS